MTTKVPRDTSLLFIIQTFYYKEILSDLCSWRRAATIVVIYTLYQERAVFGKMKMDPGKRAQTQNAGEV